MAVGVQVPSFVSAWRRARWAEICLICAAVLAFCLLMIEATLGRFADYKALELYEGLSGFVTLFYILALILSAVTFLRWLHRGVKNLSSLGAIKLRFTPGWAVGWFFVPGFNLVRPSEVVTELWHASDPAIPSYEPTRRAAPALVRWWWGLFILSGLTERFAYQQSLHTSRGVFDGQVHLLLILSYVLAIPAAILAIRVMGAINQNQERKHNTSSTGVPL